MEDISPSSLDIEKKISNLTSQVEQYTATPLVQEQKSYLNLNLNSMYVYMAVPVVVLILLVIMKPSFVKIENEEGKKEVKAQKIILWTLIFGAIINIGIYGFTHKPK